MSSSQFLLDAEVTGFGPQLDGRAASSVPNYATQAAFAASSTQADTVYVHGRAARGDGGDARFQISTDGVIRYGDIVLGNGRRYQIASETLDPAMFGDPGELIVVNNGVTTLATPTLVRVSSIMAKWSGFTADYVGKRIAVRGAGAATSAYGYVKVTAQPQAADTFTVNADVVTWTAGAPGAGQVQIGATRALSAAALAAYITGRTGTNGVTAVATNNEIKITANAAGTAGNAIAISSSTGLAREKPRVECLQTLLAFGKDVGGAAGANAPWHVSTISAVTDTQHVVIADPVAAAFASTSVVIWTDGSDAMETALWAARNKIPASGAQAAGDLQSNLTNDMQLMGRFNNFTGQGMAYDGIRPVVLRNRGRGLGRGRYTISREMSFNGNILEWKGNTGLYATPDFSGATMIGTDTAGTDRFSKLVNASLQGMTFADQGVWVRSSNQFTFEGRTRTFGVRRYPIHIGVPDGTRAVCTQSTFIWNEWQPLNVDTGTLNEPSGAGVLIEDGHTDNQFGKVMSQGYRTGFREEGGANTWDDVHVWTSATAGSMTIGFDLRANTSRINGIAYADSPCADPADPTAAGQTTYGAVFRGKYSMQHLKVYLNTGALPTQIIDDQCIGAYSYYQGVSGHLTVGALHLAVGSGGKKYKKGFDASDITAMQSFEVGEMPSAAAIITAGAQTMWTRQQLQAGGDYVAGRYYVADGTGTPAAGVATTLNTMRGYKGRIRKALTINILGARVSTASAGGKFQLAIYRADPDTGAWTTLVINSADISTTSATALTDNIANTILPPGDYWWFSNCDNSVAAFSSISDAQLVQMGLMGATSSSTIGSSALVTGQYINQTYGAWPADLTGVAADGTITTKTVAVIEFRPV